MILTRKVDQNDLVFGMRSRFISRSVHTRSQVCVQWLRFVPPRLALKQTHSPTHTDRQQLTSSFCKFSQLSYDTNQNI